jgi:hypothetical protein
MPELIVRADAGFEALLGVLLIAAGATGALAARDFPHPVGRPLIVASGLALLPVAAIIWQAKPPSLRLLAVGNALTALLAVVWLALASGFSTAGAALTGAVVAVLVCLAFAQTSAAMARR